MSVRVVTRIRPLLKSELDKDSIVECASSSKHLDSKPTTIKIPNPKNPSESFNFQFNAVYDQHASQQEIFDDEVAPAIKHLFNGFDATIFAYGITGTGKTFTMRGGKSLGERGLIPRLLSGIYRRVRKVGKDTAGTEKVEVSMSYYEIYNDRVFDLFEPPEKRTAAGLHIRENNGKTVVAGLTERPCASLKEFEQLYDQANVNRSTSATKLNAHSSRSHAILCVKVSQFRDEHMIVSRVSAIDLAGSEDNRRTDNEKERLVESSSINKSLFVLAQCVEAITKSRPRVPYRESKMTRILSLGQNNGLTIMILNLAPVRSYHLDTLSSLNFANRTKKIEIRDVENEPILRYLGKVAPSSSSVSGTSFHRQPLRPIPAAANIGLSVLTSTKHKKARSFSVFIEHEKPDKPVDRQRRDQSIREANNSHFVPGESNDNQDPGNTHVVETAAISAKLEEIIDRMVDEKLAKRVRAEPDSQSTRCLSDELRQRLEALEQRVDHKENHRAEGLQYLLMAKQHQCHGEDASALKMYQLALPYFPDNEKLAHKLLNLQSKISQKKPVDMQTPKSLATSYHERQTVSQLPLKLNRITSSKDDCENHAVGPKIDHDELDEDDNYRAEPAPRKAVKRLKLRAFHDTPMELDDNLGSGPDSSSPRTLHLLRIINSRDVTQIRLLKGVGAKKAEVIVNCLCGEAWESEEQPGTTITTLAELSALKGVGLKTVENMRAGIAIP